MANGKTPKMLFVKIPPAVASPKTRYHCLWFLAFKKANIEKVTKNHEKLRNSMSNDGQKIQIDKNLRLGNGTTYINFQFRGASS